MLKELAKVERYLRAAPLPRKGHTSVPPPPCKAKYSDTYEVETSSEIFLFKNDATNVSDSDVSKEGGKNDASDNLTLKIESGSVSGLEESNSINESYTLRNTDECSSGNEGNVAGNWTIPDGFQFLPDDLFLFEGIPPPLVSSSWLKLLGSDEECGEDSIPLAKLKKKIKKRKKKTGDSAVSNVHKNKRNGEKQKSESDYCPIKRKRGRPKKHLDKTAPTEDEFPAEESDNFWNDKTSISNCDVPAPDDIDVKVETDSSAGVDGYFKSGENENGEVVEDGEKKEKEKKKKQMPIQGVKIGDSKISFPCLECGKSFSAASTLKCHQRLHNGTLLVCPECRKGFVSKYLLKCHMRIHNGDLFMCHKCGRGFTTAELLKVHSRAHTGDRPFVCNVCGKSFPTSSNMLQHKQIHNSEKKFLCSQCGSSFVQKRCLDYHMLTHAEKKNICNACGKLWARKSDLVEHMRIHTGVKPYCCSICPQKFSQASSLKRHQLVHMDVKTVQCGTCNKMFKCQEYYKRHLRKHEKED